MAEILLNYLAGKLATRLRKYVAKDKNLQKVLKAVQKDFAQSGLTAHNWEHIWRDTLNAIVIGEAEKADMTVVLPAIIMHDIGFLYGADGKTHGEIGARKLASFLKKHKISYSPVMVKHMTECIRTHKGSMHGEKPHTLEAKAVADADMLEKFGPFGVYQHIRTFTEFDKDIETVLTRMDAIDELHLETKTGRKIAEKGRRFVKEFYAKLDKAYEPYRQ